MKCGLKTSRCTRAKLVDQFLAWPNSCLSSTVSSGSKQRSSDKRDHRARQTNPPSLHLTKAGAGHRRCGESHWDDVVKKRGAVAVQFLRQLELSSSKELEIRRLSGAGGFDADKEEAGLQPGLVAAATLSFEDFMRNLMSLFFLT